MAAPPIVLSIAGYDPSSGAGVTADVKTAAALGCYAATCITALTVQSTQGVFGVQSLRPELVMRTLRVLADDLPIAAVRIGMLGSGEAAEAVASFLESTKLPNVVLDPVIRSSSGAALLDDAGLEVVRKRLLPLSDVITPNIDEAAVLASAAPISFGDSWEAVSLAVRQLADQLHGMGAKAVVVTGGHLSPANDYLSYGQGAEQVVVPGERIASSATHGTGCAFATALACGLARGNELPQAVRGAKDYVRRAILAAYPLGKGIGPINHGG